MKTNRNDLAYQFCPGCSHGLILDALNRALVRMQGRNPGAWDAAAIVIVTDIGCAGLSDQYFATSGFHGLHGRSLTYAAGIKLARPELHVINLIGDGGCGIGGTHLINAARRDIGVTTLVFNNLNFGMTGGEHSVTTPSQQRTSTTPWGNREIPLDIAATVAANGARYVWRGTAYAPELDQQIEAALAHDGFALLDIWELCVAYYASFNKVSPRTLTTEIARLGFEEGLLQTKARPAGPVQLQRDQASRSGHPPRPIYPIDVRFESELREEVSLVIAGSAGGHIRTAGRLICTAATMSDLWTTQRDDYPVTVRAGHSLSQIQIAPQPIAHTACQQIDVLFVLDERGMDKVEGEMATMIRAAPAKDRYVFVAPELIDRVREAKGGQAPGGTRAFVIDVSGLKGVARASQGLAVVAAGLAWARILTPDALIAAAAVLNPTYAEANQKAVQQALAALDTVVLPL
jgi:2-oxoglutarate/2-oxoacid ferredoxin oxidoreductase subunit beta